MRAAAALVLGHIVIPAQAAKVARVAAHMAVRTAAETAIPLRRILAAVAAAVRRMMIAPLAPVALAAPVSS